MEKCQKWNIWHILSATLFYGRASLWCWLCRPGSRKQSHDMDKFTWDTQDPLRKVSACRNLVYLYFVLIPRTRQQATHPVQTVFCDEALQSQTNVPLFTQMLLLHNGSKSDGESTAFAQTSPKRRHILVPWNALLFRLWWPKWLSVGLLVNDMRKIEVNPSQAVKVLPMVRWWFALPYFSSADFASAVKSRS